MNIYSKNGISTKEKWAARISPTTIKINETDNEIQLIKVRL